MGIRHELCLCGSIIPRIFRNFFREKLLQDFSLFREKTAAKKVRKKSGLKTLLLAKIGRKFTDFLEESSNFCPLPQSVSLKNVPDFKSHNLPIHFHASFKERNIQKRTFAANLWYNIFFAFFSHFREKLYFSFVFREKSKMRKNAEV